MSEAGAFRAARRGEPRAPMACAKRPREGGSGSGADDAGEHEQALHRATKRLTLADGGARAHRGPPP